MIRLPALISMMTFERSSDRRRLHPPLAWCLVAFIVALGVFAGNSTVEASIVGPGVPQFSLEPSCAGAAPVESQETGKPSDRQSDPASATHRELTLLMAQQGPSSSTSSTSGSSSLAGTGATAALTYVPASLLCDPAVAGWVSGERQVALTTPPGNELLRPPRMS